VATWSSSPDCIKKTKKKRVKNAMTCSIPRRGYAVPILRRVSSERFALSASVVSDHTEEAFTSCYELNSTRLNRESRTQVSSTSISASLIHTIINKQYHFMTSSDRFPVPVRSAVKSNLTNWCCQNLTKHALNALTVKVSTTELGKLFQIFTVHAEKK